MKKIETYEAQRQSGILLNANESSDDLASDIIREFIQQIDTVNFNRYPDMEQRELLEAYASVMGLKPSQLLAGNGSDQLLGYLIGTYLSKGKVLYTLKPDFSMYDYYASSYEADVCKYEMEPDGTYDIDDFIRNGKGASMVMFSNPNNPTGHCLKISEVRKILEGFAGLPVVVDEAYMEFADEESALSLLDEYDNLYVTRTLSKAYGLAGIRTGFLVSSEKNMEPLKKAFVPYALNSVSMKIASVSLAHHDEMTEKLKVIRSERNRMYDIMKNCRGISVLPSQANFIYGRCSDVQRLFNLFDEAGIIIRRYAGTDAFRITTGRKDENDKVLEVIRRFEETIG